MTRLDKIRTEFSKIGMDKNLEISDFSIYHLAGFSGVLSATSKFAPYFLHHS